MAAERIILLEQARERIFILDNHPIRVLTAPPGYLIDVREQYNTNVRKGFFTAVVEFGSLLQDRGMSEINVPKNQRWNKENVPSGINILEFNRSIGDEIAAAADELEETANHHPKGNVFLDPYLVKNYFHQDSIIAAHQKPLDIDTRIPLAIVRGGMSGLMAAGIPAEKQFPIDAKRLNSLKESKHLAVGITYDPEKIAQLKGRNIYSREIAFATGSSLIAVDMLLAALDCLPSSSMWSATVATQPGIDLVLLHRELMKGFGKETEINIGRLAYVMTGPPHPYYIISEKGRPSVYDGGDATDLLIPGQYRGKYPAQIGPSEMERLQLINPLIAQLVTVDTEVNMDLMMNLQNRAMYLGINQYAVGHAITGVDWEEFAKEQGYIQ